MLSHIPQRLAWLLLALATLAPLALARALQPAAARLGTHTQLGLPPCAFLRSLHLPCPACGLTTALAHLAHGDLAASLAAHPLGLALGLAALASGLRACAGIVRPVPVAAWWLAPVRVRAALTLTLTLALTWLARLASTL